MLFGHSILFVLTLEKGMVDVKAATPHNESCHSL
jgi:hypothetical protein